jgi:hypothetical protein
MNAAREYSLAVAGGLCGAAGTLCYILAAFVPMGDNLSYAVVMLWPILSVVLCYAMFRFVGAAGGGPLNGLAFAFACIAFATLASMISIQLAVRMGIAEHAASAPASDKALYAAVLKSARMVDLGMDVAWDFFIGTYMAILGVVLSGDPRFGKAWGIPTSLLGVALVVLNAITFPWPPDTRDLFDLGPFIGVFIIALSVRLAIVGVRGRRTAGP